MFYQASTLNCQGQIVDLSQPKIMGILNITPDSFFDGGAFVSLNAIIAQTEKMLAQGATIIDLGGMSSRPGAALIPVSEELERVLPAVKAILKSFPGTILSIDTIRSEVAKACLDAGASIINDISAGSFDPQLFPLIGEYNCPYILMHMLGKPEDMQLGPQYDQVVVSVMDFLIEKMGQLRALGVKDVVIDPGFGFGKSIGHNYELLKNLSAFKILEAPILVGLSRKSMIHKVLSINAQTALNGTTALHMVALQNGARLLRVHDVKAAQETITLWQRLENTPVIA